jgi:phosphatidylserine decarboxylase
LLKSVVPRIHRAGWPFIGLFAAVALVLGLLFEPRGWVGAAATLWCVAFFRDPERVPPAGSDLVVAAADGVVMRVCEAAPPQELGLGDEPLTRVSVFMNVFDVHVNRIPVDATVTKLAYRPGRFFNATLDKSSEHNERMSIRLSTASGHDLAVVQIAGLVARRIQCGLAPDQRVRAGERFGIIRFGSRVDIYLPQGFRVFAREGQRAVAGETVIAQAVSGGPSGGAARPTGAD